jgi:hypothetical protein
MFRTLKTEDKILDNAPLYTNVGAVNDVVQSFLFVHLFTNVTYALQTAAHWFFLPAALAGDSVRAVLGLLNYINARNKNLGRTAKLLIEIVKISIVATAILGTLIGITAIAAIGPLLFIAAIGSNTLYHAALSIFHATKWATSKTPLEASFHRRETGLNLFYTGVGAVFVTTIAVLLAFNPGIALLSSVTAIVAGVTFGLSALAAGVMGYINVKNRAVRKAVDTERDLVQQRNILTPIVLPKQTVGLTRENQGEGETLDLAFVPKLSIKTYLPDLINDMKKLSDEEQRDFIVKLISDKNDSLDKEKNNFDFFYPNKQSAKQVALEYLSVIVQGKIVTLDAEPGKTPIILRNVDELVTWLDKTGKSETVFNSFFCQFGEVQKIFALANTYLAHKPMPVVTSDERLTKSVETNANRRSSYLETETDESAIASAARRRPSNLFTNETPATLEAPNIITKRDNFTAAPTQM